MAWNIPLLVVRLKGQYQEIFDIKFLFYESSSLQFLIFAFFYFNFLRKFSFLLLLAPSRAIESLESASGPPQRSKMLDEKNREATSLVLLSLYQKTYKYS